MEKGTKTEQNDAEVVQERRITKEKMQEINSQRRERNKQRHRGMKQKIGKRLNEKKMMKSGRKMMGNKSE